MLQPTFPRLVLAGNGLGDSLAAEEGAAKEGPGASGELLDDLLCPLWPLADTPAASLTLAAVLGCAVLGVVAALGGRLALGDPAAGRLALGGVAAGGVALGSLSLLDGVCGLEWVCGLGRVRGLGVDAIVDGVCGGCGLPDLGCGDDNCLAAAEQACRGPGNDLSDSWGCCLHHNGLGVVRIDAILLCSRHFM